MPEPGECTYSAKTKPTLTEFAGTKAGQGKPRLDLGASMKLGAGEHDLGDQNELGFMGEFYSPC